MLPEKAVGVKMLGQRYQLRIEPAAAAFAQDLDRAVRALFGGENIEVLSDSEDSGFRRNRLAGAPFRIAAAVPVLIKAANRFGGNVSESEFAKNVGAPIATESDDFPIIAVLGEANVSNAGNAAQRARLRKNGAPKETKSRRFGTAGPGPVFELDAGFDQAFIATADDLAEARGVAAAADVFEKQSIVEAGSPVGGKAKLAGQAHAEDAAAERVTGYGPFG